MDNYQRHREVAKRAGGEDWELLVDALSDSKFTAILSSQDEQIFNNFRNNPDAVNSYKSQLADILAKYIGWKVYQESNLRKINKEIDDLSRKVVDAEGALQTLRDTAAIISGATALVAYSKTFAESANTHGERAKKEQSFYFYSLIGFSVITSLVFFFSVADVPYIKGLIADDVKSLPFSTGILALKIFLLIFAYQITQFFRKNYGAEKHLEEVYQHRSDVLQSLHAVYEALKDNTEERAKILSAGALFAYERGETGYITTKEGAGSAGDGLVESLLLSIVKK